MQELCPECQKLTFEVKVERYRSQVLERCTVHHWLMNARGRGWELDRFVADSERYNFDCSLPTVEQVDVILAIKDDTKP
ncbi:MAG: hypothetical protein OK456_01580 [Thaumarchaeota archaeon]|nr:hypothetical protein [Nitrososphaerota archaeon]